MDWWYHDPPSVRGPSRSKVHVIIFSLALRAALAYAEGTIWFLVSTVSSTQILAVGITGKIEGKVICQIADIAGHVKDDLRVNELLIIRAGSIISGTIYYKEIEIEKGAKITGRLSML